MSLCRNPAYRNMVLRRITCLTLEILTNLGESVFLLTQLAGRKSPRKKCWCSPFTVKKCRLWVCGDWGWTQVRPFKRLSESCSFDHLICFDSPGEMIWLNKSATSLSLRIFVPSSVAFDLVPFLLFFPILSVFQFFIYALPLPLLLPTLWQLRKLVVAIGHSRSLYDVLNTKSTWSPECNDPTLRHVHMLYGKLDSDRRRLLLAFCFAKVHRYEEHQPHPTNQMGNSISITS